MKMLMVHLVKMVWVYVVTHIIATYITKILGKPELLIFKCWQHKSQISAKLLWVRYINANWDASPIEESFFVEENKDFMF